MNSPILTAEKTNTKVDTKSPFLMVTEPDGTMYAVVNPDYQLDLRWYLVHMCGYSRTDAGFTVEKEKEALKKTLSKSSMQSKFQELLLDSMKRESPDFIINMIRVWFNSLNNGTSNNRA